ncbi:MAG: hypothetical protein Q7S09_01720 [bacterium]|nr:hypothetical protein [bacterium]
MDINLLQKDHPGQGALKAKLPLIAIAGWVVVLVIVIALALPEREKPGIPVLRPAVLETREDKLPSQFPAELPLEKSEPGFELTQSTGSLDYLAKTAGYVVAFKSPWSKDEAVRRYGDYLKDNGYRKDFQNQVNGNTVFLQGSSDQESVSVTITEERPVVPADISEAAAAGLAKNFPPAVRIAISYAKQ